METIISAIIGTTGIIIGSLITVYHNDLLTFLKVRKTNSDLIGNWDVVWYEYSTNKKGPVQKKVASDVIKIRKIKNNKIDINVENPHNVDYHLVGTIINYNFITVQFQINEPYDSFAGVAVLTISRTRLLMEGIWSQPVPEDESDFIIGRTYWKKIIKNTT